MRRYFTIALSVTLIMSVIMLLTGCASHSEKENILGTWKCELDLTERINSDLSFDTSVISYSGTDQFKLDMYMQFRDDDTYKVWIAEESLDDAMDQLIQSMTADLFRYMEDLLLKEEDREMTIDEILESTGVSEDELVEQMFPQETRTALKTQIVGQFNKEGWFKAEEGKLFTSADLEHAVDSAVYEKYTLEGNVLTLHEYINPEGEYFLSMYPMEFHRQK